jgi:hypothetical protein
VLGQGETFPRLGCLFAGGSRGAPPGAEQVEHFARAEPNDGGKGHV